MKTPSNSKEKPNQKIIGPKMIYWSTNYRISVQQKEQDLGPLSITRRNAHYSTLQGQTSD